MSKPRDVVVVSTVQLNDNADPAANDDGCDEWDLINVKPSYADVVANEDPARAASDAAKKNALKKLPLAAPASQRKSKVVDENYHDDSADVNVRPICIQLVSVTMK